MRFMNPKEIMLGLSWSSARPNEFGGVTLSQSGYGILFSGASRHLIVNRSMWDTSGSPVYNVGLPSLGDIVFILEPGLWHYLEISTYQGQLQVWVDGNNVFEAQDDMPLPPGGFSIQGSQEVGVQYVDAITVCGLSAPFTSMQPPVPLP